MIKKMRYWTLTGMVLSVTIGLPAMAEINVTHYWDMGETNITNGDAVGERLDTAGFQTGPVANNDMPNLGSTAPAWNLGHSISSTGPTYSTDAAPGGSTASVDFSGNTLDSLGTTKIEANFGFELWVKPKDTLNRNIAYNGQRGGVENGYGFEQNGGEFVAYYGGATILRGVPTGAPVVPNVWTHLAIVTKWDGVNTTTLVTTFYINGEVVDSFIGVPPNSPNGSPNGIDGFYIGSNRTVGTAYSKIDEVRLFSFDPGAFDAINDLANGIFAPRLDGDLNGDGFVGIADLNVVLGNWNQNVTAGDLLAGDPSGDGFVGIADLNVVLGNWNAGTPPSATSASQAESTAMASAGPTESAILPRSVDVNGGTQADQPAERGDRPQLPVAASRAERSRYLTIANGRTSGRSVVDGDAVGRSPAANSLRVQETDTHGDTIVEATDMAMAEVASNSGSMGNYTLTLAESSSPLEGDLDGDGFVGVSDLDIVRAHWNQAVTVGDPLQGDVAGPGDGPADGLVGVADLSAVLSNWNAGTATSEN